MARIISKDKHNDSYSIVWMSQIGLTLHLIEWDTRIMHVIKCSDLTEHMAMSLWGDTDWMVWLDGVDLK